MLRTTPPPPQPYLRVDELGGADEAGEDVPVDVLG
jgi:hypothetical protein